MPIVTSSTIDSAVIHKVVLVYQHAFLRDLFTRIFADAGIVVVATIGEAELEGASLQDLGANVIVSDDATSGTLGAISQAILFSSEPFNVIKVIAVGVDSLVSITYRKDVIVGAGIEELISQAQHALPPNARGDLEVSQTNSG